MNYFVTAIGTDSGKTLVSAILCEALEADYWKPVQSGLPRDTETVSSLVTNRTSVFHPERFLLSTPVSPHAAAKADGVTIDIDAFHLPKTANTLVVEGAGGCLVPLSEQHLIIDLIAHLNLETVLVSNLYLGSINHTLLTFEALKKRYLPVRGIIFNGDANEESEQIILQYTKLRCLLRIKKESEINREVVRTYARALKKNWHE